MVLDIALAALDNQLCYDACACPYLVEQGGSGNIWVIPIHRTDTNHSQADEERTVLLNFELAALLNQLC